MPFSKENTYTTDYIYSLPEGQRAELIDGVIYDMAPPNRLHQKIQQALAWSIETYIRKNNGSCISVKTMDFVRSILPHSPFF